MDLHPPISYAELDQRAEAFRDRPTALDFGQVLEGVNGVNDWETFYDFYGLPNIISVRLEGNVGDGRGIKVMSRNFANPDHPAGKFAGRWIDDEGDHACSQSMIIGNIEDFMREDGIALPSARDADHVPGVNYLIGGLADVHEVFAGSVDFAVFKAIGGTEELTTKFYGHEVRHMKGHDVEHIRPVNQTFVQLANRLYVPTIKDEAHHRGFAVDYIDWLAPKLRPVQLIIGRYFIENMLGIVGTGDEASQREFGEVMIHLQGLGREDPDRPQVAAEIMDVLDGAREDRMRSIVGRIEAAMQSRAEQLPEGVEPPRFENMVRRILRGHQQALAVAQRERDLPDEARAHGQVAVMNRFVRERLQLCLSLAAPEAVAPPEAAKRLHLPGGSSQVTTGVRWLVERIRHEEPVPSLANVS